MNRNYLQWAQWPGMCVYPSAGSAPKQQQVESLTFVLERSCYSTREPWNACSCSVLNRARRTPMLRNVPPRKNGPSSTGERTTGRNTVHHHCSVRPLRTQPPTREPQKVPSAPENDPDGFVCAWCGSSCPCSLMAGFDRRLKFCDGRPFDGHHRARHNGGAQIMQDDYSNQINAMPEGDPDEVPTSISR